MKGRLIALDHWDGREAAALMVDGRLEDLLVDPLDAPRLGAIFMAKLERPLKGQGGAIVSWPGGSGFLRRAKGLSAGEMCLVQVSGFAEPGKAPPVSDKLLFKSRYAIITPGARGLNISRAIRDDDRRDALQGLAHEGMAAAPDGHGLILRSAASAASDEDILEDISAMRDAAEAVLSEKLPVGLVTQGDGPHLHAWREWSETAEVDASDGSFEAHGILDEIEPLFSARVALGAHNMAVEPTRALVAVDVDTGADVSPAAALKANLAALKELPRQLRLRGLAGQITIDLAPVAKRDRRQIEAAARAALRVDPVETELIGWTPLGHLELKRKRERTPLSTQARP
ncbi:MAG: ribonuclease E/G [Pseudomonadota bacterium]